MGKPVSFLLPGLSDSEISIYDRLKNIAKLNKLRADKTSWKNMDMFSDDIYIENLRAFVMMLVLDIIPREQENQQIKDLSDWYQRYAPSGNIPDALVDALCLNFVPKDYTHQIIDIIHYYNDNVKLLNTHLSNSPDKLYHDSFSYYNAQDLHYYTKKTLNDTRAPEYKIIDLEYLYVMIDDELYETNRSYVHGVHELIDVMYPDLPKVDPSEYLNNQGMMIKGVKNTLTIYDRMDYLLTMETNIRTCASAQILHLRDSIFTEKLRIFLLYYYTDHEKTEEMRNVKYYVNTHHLDIRYDPSYIVNYSMDNCLGSHTFPDVIDILYYFNTKDGYDIDVEYLEKNAFKHYENLSSYPLYNYLKSQFRIDTINNIINI